MPTYDYRCDACGHIFEVLEKMSDGGVKACARCGKKKAHRKISAPAGLIFKGSGFYVTDRAIGRSAASGDAKKKTTRKTTETKGESKTESKTESKGESKTEKK